MIFDYFPGCTLKNTGRKLDTYGRLCAEALGFALCEPENWQCCGAVYPQAKDEIATRLSAVRALSAAHKNGRELVTLCSACHHVLKRTNYDMRNDSEFREKVNNYVGADAQYHGETEVLHYLEVLRDKVGFENLSKFVKNPLTGKKIGAYYGCLLLRPSREMAMDDSENPHIMEDFIRALGAEPVVFAMRNECCGAYTRLQDKSFAAKSAMRITENARNCGAQMLITACPLCMYNLTDSDGEMPVYYFTELLAEALGVKEKEHE